MCFAQIIQEHRKGYEFVWFTNPLPLASIPTVGRIPLTHVSELCCNAGPWLDIPTGHACRCGMPTSYRGLFQTTRIKLCMPTATDWP